ncbi:hypothetical protein VHEMI06599 [[Torrubiella] hemipterigena]|uniref:Leucine Rich Repeat domain protein n=1 Tax=[Torrubiella] hemipterigena TaxID=1531966 RepID=A0A0A1TJH3_9HYPO|nr:hypothetical protein VHEMI06599 [[Torrubiella] hemipterigena]
MAEEPSLPALPAVSWDAQSQSFSKGSRKRLRPDVGGQLFCSSSDPAVFSSDDDPGLDNYVAGRRKRKYLGSWYNQFPTSSDSAYSDGQQPLPKQKRTLRRQLDSGVYLGSDGTDTDDMLELPVVPTTPTRPIVVRPNLSRLSEAEKAAREKIRVCLEKGEESIDFWSMGLRELSNETISPLTQLSHIPQVTKDVAFETKEPELKIYLARNSLGRLPGALFDLTHLTVLSIRENNISELPPSICRLTNLTELNVSQNRLQYLPAEFTDLFQPESKLKKLVLFPNPFFKPQETLEHSAPMAATAVEKLSDWQPRFLSRHLGNSQIQTTTSQGRVLSKFKFPACDSSVTLPVFNADSVCDEPRPSRVPSLMEAAARSCADLAKPAELAHFVPEGLENLRHLILQTAAQKQDGGLVCSHCRRSLVRPTLEWVEWKQLYVTVKNTAEAASPAKKLSVKPLSMAKDEMAIPFKHLACSWLCGPVSQKSDKGWGQHVKDWVEDEHEN